MDDKLIAITSEIDTDKTNSVIIVDGDGEADDAGSEDVCGTHAAASARDDTVSGAPDMAAGALTLGGWSMAAAARLSLILSVMLSSSCTAASETMTLGLKSEASADPAVGQSFIIAI